MKAFLAVIALLLISTQAQTAGGYTEQDVSIVSTDSTFASILSFAETTFIQQAYAAGKITTPEFTSEQVLSVATQVVAGMNYQFVVEFTDSEGESVYATLTVFSQPWTNTQTLTSYTVSDAPSF